MSLFLRKLLGAACNCETIFAERLAIPPHTSDKTFLLGRGVTGVTFVGLISGR